jgi:hypothetical protein
MQESDGWVGRDGAPFVKVKQSEGTYFTLPAGAYHTRAMARRASSTQSEGSGWTVSTDTYKCERWAVHTDEDWNDRADEDPVLQSDAEAADWLANQGMMHHDYVWQLAVMQPATWTTDYDGVTGTPSTNEVKRWDASGATPQADVETWKDAIRGLTGKKPNLIVAGSSVHKAMLTNSIFRTAYQNTIPTEMATMDQEERLAKFFGVEKYRVARAFHNTANSGQTASIGKIVNAVDLWIGYVAPKPGKKVLSAAYTFAYPGANGVGVDGITTNKFEIKEITSDRSEFECFWDVKVVSADCGGFCDDLVS